MERILDPARIEAFAQRSIARVRLPDAAQLFGQRAARLRLLAAAPGQGIGDYLSLMATVAQAQHAASADLKGLAAGASAARGGSVVPPPAAEWRPVLEQVAGTIAGSPDLPAGVREVCARLRASGTEDLEAQAACLLGTQARARDAAAAPFLMSALQVCWTRRAGLLTATAVGTAIAGGCPVCGTLPVASTVRVDHGSQGYRYLHCPLCATEWHMVRVLCTQCQADKGISYHSIEGGAPAIRAEACDNCRSYRKIFYQEQDMGVEPVADDLASLTLDLLMSEAGYHRASGNPLLWQRPDA